MWAFAHPREPLFNSAASPVTRITASAQKKSYILNSHPTENLPLPLTVTMKIFSGRPNPVWVLPEAAANEYHDRLSRIRNTAPTSNLKPLGALGGLGYRGFKVQAIGDPTATYIHAGIIDSRRHNPTFLPDDRA